MKIWLTCFGLLFVGAELFQWAMQLEIGQFSGGWLILGGLILAAASNATHLPQWNSEQRKSASKPPEASVEADKTAGQDRAKRPATRAEEDSISFEVRSPYR